jgi:hypothetical protein
MGDRESQVHDGSFEAVRETGESAVVFATILGNNAGRELARNGSARRAARGFEVRQTFSASPIGRGNPTRLRDKLLASNALSHR